MPDLDLSVDLSNPASYPPADQLTRECDLVMKGGITSGVVYPRAVCQLATDHRIRNVGGSSAGAIAAGMAAAAERGRADGAFAKLAALPEWLGAAAPDGRGTNLFGVFQPQPATKPLHRVATAFIRKGSTLTKARRGVVALALALRPLPVLAVLLPAVVLLVLAITTSTAVGIVAAALLAVVALLVTCVWSVLIHVLKRLPENGFGLVAGMRTPGSEVPGLSEWLADTLDDLAGVSPGPLTLGDLRDAEVELAMLTTNLTDGTQQRVPFGHRVWAFSPEELRDVLPPRVIDWMVAHPPEIDGESLSRFRAVGLHPLPYGRAMPAVLAVRMSLSFPGLLSAVPLHRIDFSDPGQPIVRHWFSDGGITSNFPLHFFDNPIPRRPTFAINLGPTEELDPDPCENVWLPGSHLEGIHEPPRELTTMVHFGNRLKDCLQNWADNAQTHVPGYRDRIVKVFHTSDEGGMNLDMGETEIAGLAERGRCAGAVLQQEFDFADHRWTRYRSFMHAVQDLLRAARAGHDAPSAPPTYVDMIAAAPPTSYRKQWDPAFGRTHTDSLMAWARAVEAAAPGSFARGAPSPRPRLQLRPDHPDVDEP
jgi:predicted acylesterase/phospholipase RssA